MTASESKELDGEFLDHALSVAIDAADAAAKLIERYYAAGFSVSLKDDQTPVTDADVAAERVIRQHLLAAFPAHAIFGEEEGQAGESDFLWLVDPIDGTKSFVRGYPMFSTQIALMYRNALVLGVSAAGEYGETMWARRDGGAFLRDANGLVRPARVAPLPKLTQRALSTGNLKSLTRGPGWQALGDIISGIGRIRGYGDFLHYHLLARGSIDAVIESDLNILDIAALAVIVREAGGIFTDLDGAELGLATRSSLAAAPDWHVELQQHFQGWRDE